MWNQILIQRKIDEKRKKILALEEGDFEIGRTGVRLFIDEVLTHFVHTVFCDCRKEEPTFVQKLFFYFGFAPLFLSVQHWFVCNQHQKCFG